MTQDTAEPLDQVTRTALRGKTDVGLSTVAAQITDDASAILSHAASWQFRVDTNRKALDTLCACADSLRVLRDELDLSARSLAAAALDRLDDDDMDEMGLLGMDDD